MSGFEIKDCVLLSLMSGMPPAFDLPGAARPNCGVQPGCAVPSLLRNHCCPRMLVEQ